MRLACWKSGNLIAAFLLISFAEIRLEAQAQEITIQRALDREGASKILLRRLIKERVFSNIPIKCLFADLDEETAGYFLFTVRYDPKCCGIQTESTLLDRFAVIRHSQEIVWWDVADPEQFKPWAVFLRHQSKFHRKKGPQ